MNIKRILIGICILPLMLLPVGCGKDFLESPIKKSLFRSEFVQDLASAQTFLNGIYMNFSVANGTGISGSYPELSADNFKPANTIGRIYSWNQEANESEPLSVANATNMNKPYRDFYLVIHSCNFLLSAVEEFRNENPDLADQIKGQCHLYRALAYFQLVNIYAHAYSFTTDASHPGVILVKGFDWDEPVQNRHTVAQVYTEMINDAQLASSLLPATVPNNMLASKLTAEAILSRLYLYKGDYTNAKAYAVPLLNKMKLLSVANGYPDVIFKPLPPQVSETLLQLPPTKLFSRTDRGLYIGRYLRGSSRIFVSTADLTSLLKSKSTDVRINWVTTINGTVNEITKFPLGVVGTTPTEETQYYHPVIRLSEVCITAAEACAQLGEEADARKYLDMIRQRADASAQLSSATGNELMSLIQEERRKELCFEGLRMFDLQRWKKDVVRTDPSDINAFRLTFPSDRAISPIPVKEVRLHGIEQNKGY